MTLRVASLALLGFVWFHFGVYANVTPPPQCSAAEEPDPALVEMRVDVGLGYTTHQVYVQPDVTTFYKGELPATTPVTPKHEGLAAKFVNMSDRHLELYWTGDGVSHLMWRAPPFSTGGTASFPSHMFFYSEQGNKDAVVKNFEIGHYPENLYVYDPFEGEGDLKVDEQKLKLTKWTDKQKEMYRVLKRSLLYNEHYKKVTGRTYLANYPRAPSNHHMWRADYFEQEHWVTTRETHFLSHPPEEKLSAINAEGIERNFAPDQLPNLAEYRVEEPVMNMTMKVISCAPRAFEIQNFLSKTEVEHILNIAGGIDLKKSEVGSADGSFSGSDQTKLKTRTSFNSWVAREESPIIDAIYRRAADLMRIDESLLRERSPQENPDYMGTHTGTVAEKLQLVHYNFKQEYTAHHDYGYASADDKIQPARYATLLLYLNEEMEGGATEFVRYTNTETFLGLKATPITGKAVLFYSQLPDGNFDDFSQHAALPITAGEKWLMNLWIWDPFYH